MSRFTNFQLEPPADDLARLRREFGLNQFEAARLLGPLGFSKRWIAEFERLGRGQEVIDKIGSKVRVRDFFRDAVEELPDLRESDPPTEDVARLARRHGLKRNARRGGRRPRSWIEDDVWERAG